MFIPRYLRYSSIYSITFFREVVLYIYLTQQVFCEAFPSLTIRNNYEDREIFLERFQRTISQQISLGTVAFTF